MYIGNAVVSERGKADCHVYHVWVDEFPRKDAVKHEGTPSPGHARTTRTHHHRVFVTHSHSDHLVGMRSSVKRGNIQIVCSPACRRAILSVHPLPNPNQIFAQGSDLTVEDGPCACGDPLEATRCVLHCNPGSANVEFVSVRANHVRGALCFLFPQFFTVYVGESRFDPTAVQQHRDCLRSQKFWKKPAEAAEGKPCRLVLDGMFSHKESPVFPEKGACAREVGALVRACCRPSRGSRQRDIFVLCMYHTGGLELVRNLLDQVSGLSGRSVVAMELVQEKFFKKGKALYSDETDRVQFVETLDAVDFREGIIFLVAHPTTLQRYLRRSRETGFGNNKDLVRLRVVQVSSMWAACRNPTTEKIQISTNLFQNVGNHMFAEFNKDEGRRAQLPPSSNLFVEKVYYYHLLYSQHPDRIENNMWISFVEGQYNLSTKEESLQVEYINNQNPKKLLNCRK